MPFRKRSRAGPLAALAIIAGTGACAADPLPDVHAVAVNIERTPAQSWPGYGIYLGNGLVITAAHVAGHSLFTQPRVVVSGHSLGASALKEGSYPDDDLTVLRIDPPVPPELAGQHTLVCPDGPHPGEAVTVATPEKLTTSSVIAPPL